MGNPPLCIKVRCSTLASSKEPQRATTRSIARLHPALRPQDAARSRSGDRVRSALPSAEFPKTRARKQIMITTLVIIAESGNLQNTPCMRVGASASMRASPLPASSRTPAPRRPAPVPPAARSPRPPIRHRPAGHPPAPIPPGHLPPAPPAPKRIPLLRSIDHQQ